MDFKTNYRFLQLLAIILGAISFTGCKNDKLEKEGVPPAPVAAFEMKPVERKGLFIALRDGRSILFIDKSKFEGISLNDVKVTTPTTVIKTNTEKVGVAVMNENLFYTEITNNRLCRVVINGFRVNNPIEFVNKSSISGNNTSTLWSIEGSTQSFYITQPTVTMSFEKPGSYTVRLATSDKYGQAGKSAVSTTMQIDSLEVQTVMSIPSRPRIIAIANGFMYIAASSQPGRGIIYRGSADGGSITPFINFTMQITGLAVDVSRNKIYWTVNTERNVQLEAAGIYVADLPNGANPRLLIGGQDCDAVAVNPTNGDVYFGDYQTRSIKRVKSDGTSLQTIVSNLPNASVLGLYVDAETNRLYFSETSGTVNIVDISPSATFPIPFNRTILLASNLNNPRGIFMRK
ncbi:MAG: PKD domain-containing protein [Cytophagales bacterium]|nr:PKD domain-containing protein [Cytophagales bacterium]MDW8384269.1 PKD domain-containing protein [Flammeovirgaceae bacterium]